MPSYSGDERRSASRYPLDTAIEYCVLDPRFGDHVAKGRGLDISETGVLFQPGEPLADGLEIQLSIPWPWSPGMVRVRLNVTGRIVRTDDTGCALQIRCYQFHVVPDNRALKSA